MESLAYRSIALCRIAQVLDSVLHLAAGPSVLDEQRLGERRYQLESFTESSFLSSWQYMEAGSTPRYFSNRKEEVTEIKERDTGDEAVKEVKRHLHGSLLKRVKPSLASLEMFQEQLRAVKRKVSIWY